MPQKQYESHYDNLKNKWLDRQKELQRELVEKHSEAFDWVKNTYKHLVVGSLGSLVMLSHPMTTSITVSQQKIDPPIPPIKKEVAFADTLATPAIDPQTRLILDLSYLLPDAVSSLTEEQERVIGQTLSRHFDIPVTAELSGKRLNRSYGIIGAEQHLMRYPGDTMSSHFANPDEANKYYSSGMAPGRGAWGYFAYSSSNMTQKDIDREKYYIAVQTFLVPEYNIKTKEYSEFFKYRKMLVVNPENGHAVVVVIGDAGPAAWTGKHLGGSPEVMVHLERKDGRQKGPVLYFFIDDPDDIIPLGPIEVRG
jgi:hypothetical protein